MTIRREVRVAASFFEDLESQLGPKRGPAGEPSATDFLLVHLPVIIDVFATEFDNLAEPVEGLESLRMLIGTGPLATAFAAYGIENPETVIELMAVELEL